MRRPSLLPLLLATLCSLVGAFTGSQSYGHVRPFAASRNPQPLHVSSESSAETTGVGAESDELGLTPELRRMTDAFSSIPDEKNRYRQLLHMANQLKPVDDSVMVPENKVPGCLSTVYVDCSARMDDERGVRVVDYVGDSDGLLTKGLVALLVRGLSGCTPEEISRVDPEFINAAKISQSLTPGRNNGFLNMLAVMKRKAEEAAIDSAPNGATAPEGEEASAGEESEEGESPLPTFEEREGKPMYNAIMSTLIGVLKPTEIELVDNSHQHAGHAGSKGWEESGESHFSLEIVAEAFEGLNLVKRHQLIYMLLGEVMPKIHALQIVARTPDEA